MPVTSVAGIKRMCAMNGNRIPDALAEELDRVEGDEKAVAAVGVRWATAQCEELLARGVPGIHFFTLNRSPATREILMNLRSKGAA
jgi:methylenetetrahydrofolate reductase (NADPH)